MLARECYLIPKPDLDSLHFCVVYPLKMMLAKKPSLNLHNFWSNSDIENFRTWLTALSNLSEDKLQEILLLPAQNLICSSVIMISFLTTDIECCISVQGRGSISFLFLQCYNISLMGGWIEEEAVLKKSSQLKSCCAQEAQELIYERIDLVVVKMISIGLQCHFKSNIQ